ncbi:DUF1254 domain-containing protein [Pseudomonas sp. SIMBA_041]|uniref:DUF1254 domain-containing protein n=1 Tax=Pseudomonas sp. SIMBA_041 TaxID=3085782 RepID=UPI00397AB19A
MRFPSRRTLLAASLVLGLGAPLVQAGETPTKVTALNFIRAETDQYFAKTVREGGFGRLLHDREPTPQDKQTVVRMNRDTLYSSGVFDLDAGPVTLSLPDAGQRFMSMQVFSQDHYVTDVTYTPGPHTYNRDQVGTRYVYVIVRTLANPEDQNDIRAAQKLQDAISVRQAGKGQYEPAHWDSASQDKVRDALNTLSALGGDGVRFGTREQVNPIAHLLGTATGWGGNPEYAAKYVSVYPQRNDGHTVHRLRVRDVPVDGFWSISVYNGAGYFEKNGPGAVSLNNLTARKDANGVVTVQFGGCEPSTANCLAVTPGWNYVVRLYRPRAEILDGRWTFPAAKSQL